MKQKVEICRKKLLKKHEILLVNRSKSIYSRDIIIQNLLGTPISTDDHTSESEDIRILLEACDKASKNSFTSKDQKLNCHIYIHQSGTAMRLMTALLARTPGSFVLDGHPQARKRPLAPLVTALRSLGAEITYMEDEGYLPLRIEGHKLVSRETIDARGWESSQYVSALLLIAPETDGGLRILRRREDGSTPYIDLTIEQMKRYGASVTWEDDLITVSHSPYHKSRPAKYEMDWSSAGYWYQLLALHPGLSELHLPGLSLSDSHQGDKVVAKLFEVLGISTTEDCEGIILAKHTTADLRRHIVPTIDLSHYPDLFPTLAVTYAMLGIAVRFVGLRSLVIKESNRLDAVFSGLCAMGFTGSLSYNGDTFSYDGSSRIIPSIPIVIDSHDDHRIAMSFAVVGATIPSGLTIEGADSVRKSYPAFWNELAKVATLKPSAPLG